MGVRPPVELRNGSWASSSGATGESDLCSCYEGIFGVPLESVQWNILYVELSVLSTFSRNHGVPLEFQ